MKIVRKARIANQTGFIIPSTVRNLLLALAFLSFSVNPASAQVANGTPPFGSFAGGPDVINLGNNNVHWTFPILNKPGRGTNFFYQLAYDSSVWAPSGGTWFPATNWGWGAKSNVSLSVIGVQQSHSSCNDPSNPGQQIYDIYSFTGYTDRYGNYHPVNLRVDDRDDITSCSPDQNQTASRTLTDGSGLFVYVDDGPYAYVVNPNGTTDYPTVLSGPSSATDRNGNVISVNSSGQFFDTLSSTTPVLTVSGTGTPTSPKTFTFTAPSGASAVYTMKYATFSIQTNFGCSNIVEYGTNGTTTTSLVTEIDLPDDNPNGIRDRYTFTYEPTPSHSGFYTGRLATVTLPTGGRITYTYTAGGLTGSAVGSHDPSFARMAAPPAFSALSMTARIPTPGLIPAIKSPAQNGQPQSATRQRQRRTKRLCIFKKTRPAQAISTKPSARSTKARRPARCSANG